MMKISKKQLKILIENFLILEDNSVNFNEIFFNLYPGIKNTPSQIYNFILEEEESIKNILESDSSPKQKYDDILAMVIDFLKEINRDARDTRLKNVKTYIGFLVNTYKKNSEDDYGAQCKKAIMDLSNLTKNRNYSEIKKSSKVGEAKAEEIALINLKTKYKEDIKRIDGLEEKIKEAFNASSDEKRTAIFIDGYIKVYDEVIEDPENSLRTRTEIKDLVDAKIAEKKAQSDYEATIIKQTYTPPDGEIGTFIYYPKGKDGSAVNPLLVFVQAGEEFTAEDIAKELKKEILADGKLKQEIKNVIKDIPIYTYDPEKRNENLEKIINGLNRATVTDYEGKELKIEKSEGKIIFSAKVRSAVAKLLMSVCEHKATKSESISVEGKEIKLKPPISDYKNMATGKEKTGPSIWNKVAVEITGIDDYYEAVAVIVEGVNNLLSVAQANQDADEGSFETQEDGDIAIANEILGLGGTSLDDPFPPQSFPDDE